MATSVGPGAGLQGRCQGASEHADVCQLDIRGSGEPFMSSVWRCSEASFQGLKYLLLQEESWPSGQLLPVLSQAQVPPQILQL